jgi:hypothetical protein
MGYIALEAAGIGSSFTVGNVWNADNVTSATFTGITAQAKACLTSYNLAGGTSSLIRNGSCT